MNRVLLLLVVTAIVNVTLSRRGYRPAERNSVYGSAPRPNSRERSVGNGYGMGRYARGAGAGGGSLIHEMSFYIVQERSFVSKKLSNYNLNEFL